MSDYEIVSILDIEADVTKMLNHPNYSGFNLVARLSLAQTPVFRRYINESVLLLEHPDKRKKIVCGSSYSMFETDDFEKARHNVRLLNPSPVHTFYFVGINYLEAVWKDRKPRGNHDHP